MRSVKLFSESRLKSTMEFLAPLVLAAVGTAAANGIPIATSGGLKSQPGSIVVERDAMIADAAGMQLNNAAPGVGTVPEQYTFDPVDAHFRNNAVPGRNDNMQVLTTVTKDPKYALTPESGSDFQYDQMNRGNTHLENQWYYSNLTKDSETPLSLGYLPEYKKSTGVMLRDPDTPEMLKPKKPDLMEEDMWVAQPESDRKFYEPILHQQARRARNESKYTAGTGALDGFTMNDRPGELGGAWKGWSTGLEPTRQFTGFHPRQRFFRKADNLRQRNPHGLRAGNKESHHWETRGDLQGQYSNEKKDQLAGYHQIPAGDGGMMKPHLPHDMRRVDLRHTQREVATPVQEGFMGRQSSHPPGEEYSTKGPRAEPQQYDERIGQHMGLIGRA